jgi:hypothetical protein
VGRLCWRVGGLTSLALRAVFGRVGHGAFGLTEKCPRAVHAAVQVCVFVVTALLFAVVSATLGLAELRQEQRLALLVHRSTEPIVSRCAVGAGLHDFIGLFASGCLANGIFFELPEWVCGAVVYWAIQILGSTGTDNQKNGSNGQNRANKHRNVLVRNDDLLSHGLVGLDQMSALVPKMVPNQTGILGHNGTRPKTCLAINYLIHVAF